MTPRQGDIWWAETADKRRPVLIVSRDVAIPVLEWLVVAPVTSTVRGIPTEIALDATQGLPRACAASFDNIQPIRKSFLTNRLGSLDLARSQICRAFDALADC